jgi:CSLREA domain-containing protein
MEHQPVVDQQPWPPRTKSGGAMLDCKAFVRATCNHGRRGAAALACLGFFSAAASAAPLTFNVNSPADVPDIDPGNGVCETVAGNGVCTLRAAIQESNGHSGADTITLQPNVTYLLARVGADDSALNGDLDILDSVTITGAGPTTIVDGNGAAIHENVFSVFPCIGTSQFPPEGQACANGQIVVTISGTTVQNGRRDDGGGIRNFGDLTLQNCVVTANTAYYNGGGIYNASSTSRLALIGTVVSNNTNGDGGGGGISNGGALTIDASTMSGNAASGTFGAGGGVLSETAATVVIRNSTFANNSARVGGGIANVSSSRLDVINSTFSANSTADDGGGIYVFAGTVGLYNVTVAKNRANDNLAYKSGAIGAGVHVSTGATLYFANSILAGNFKRIPNGEDKPLADPDQCFGTLSSLGNNLLSDIDLGHCTVTGPYNVATLTLGTLQNNGGPTKTHALPAGSPAIDAGNIAGCVDGDGAPINADQRGVPRPFGSGCDVGAYEVSDVIFRNAFEIGV